MKRVVTVYDLFEIFQIIQAPENLRKLKIINATIIQDDPIDERVLKRLTRFGQRLGMANTKSVILKAQRFLLDVV